MTTISEFCGMGDNDDPQCNRFGECWWSYGFVSLSGTVSGAMVIYGFYSVRFPMAVIRSSKRVFTRFWMPNPFRYPAQNITCSIIGSLASTGTASDSLGISSGYSVWSYDCFGVVFLSNWIRTHFLQPKLHFCYTTLNIFSICFCQSTLNIYFYRLQLSEF